MLNNAVMSAFSAIGYTTVAYSTGYSVSEIHSADIRKGRFAINEFETIAGATFLHPRLWRLISAVLPGTMTKYERVTTVLATLGDERNCNDPVFAFVHLMSPHLPHEFDEDGSRWRDPYPAESGNGTASYVREVKGLNIHLLTAVERILSACEEMPIIIIQSDHGTRLSHPTSQAKKTQGWAPVERERLDLSAAMGILNAYLVPEELRDAIYPEISPVNSFRIVLGYCLGTEIPLLEDRAYFSTYSGDFDFVDVTEEVRAQ